jgi:hypothetical protein
MMPVMNRSIHRRDRPVSGASAALGLLFWTLSSVSTRSALALI